MKRLLFVLLLGGIGYLVWASYGRVWGPAEKRACVRLGELCTKSFDGDGRERCERTFAELRQTFGEEGAQRAMTCVVDSKSCTEATGCVAGAAGRAGIDLAKDFLKGLGRTISTDGDK